MAKGIIEFALGVDPQGQGKWVRAQSELAATGHLDVARSTIEPRCARCLAAMIRGTQIDFDGRTVICLPRVVGAITC